MAGFVTALLILGCGIFVFIQYAVMQRKQEQAVEDLRKLRLDLHQDGWNPDRIGKGPAVEPTEADFASVISKTQDSLRSRGLKAKAGMFDADTAEQMREAFANDPRFRFSKDANGNLMVGLNEDYEA